MKIEKARIADVTQMHQLIKYFADRGEMLARPLSEIYEYLRDYFLIRQDDRVVGCVALHIMWSDLAEVKSLAVAEDQQRHGMGDQLVAACLAEAREIGITTIFALTYKPAFFERHGFHKVDKMELPHKVWTECYRCAKFPNCDEVAVSQTLGESA